MSRTGAKANSLKQPKEEINVKYMHRPPTISPNYGNQKRSLLPKSKVSRVLLYDNATQDHMLDIKLSHINIEKERICRLINLHKRSFSTQQMKKQHMMQQSLSAGSKSNNAGSHHTLRSNNPLQKAQSQQDLMDSFERLPELEKPANESVNEVNGTGNSNEATENVATATGKDTDADWPENENNNVSDGDFKLPVIENDQRHVIFKLKDATGNTKIYHTVDENKIFGDLIPIHTFYPRLIDDPRFRSLQNSLVPTYNGNN